MILKVCSRISNTMCKLNVCPTRDCPAPACPPVFLPARRPTTVSTDRAQKYRRGSRESLPDIARIRGVRGRRLYNRVRKELEVTMQQFFFFFPFFSFADGRTPPPPRLPRAAVPTPYDYLCRGTLVRRMSLTTCREEWLVGLATAESPYTSPGTRTQ